MEVPLVHGVEPPGPDFLAAVHARLLARLGGTSLLPADSRRACWPPQPPPLGLCLRLRLRLCLRLRLLSRRCCGGGGGGGGGPLRRRRRHGRPSPAAGSSAR